MTRNNLNDSALNILGEETSSIKMCLKMSENLVKGNIDLDEEINNQNNLLKKSNSKLDIILEKFPAIGKVLSSINFHKYKEKIILGIIIGIIVYFGLFLIYNKK